MKDNERLRTSVNEHPNPNLIEIRLQSRAWHIDLKRQLGVKGGFGAVYEGKADDGTSVAIKRLNAGAVSSAERELEVALSLEGKVHRHVIPIFDSGQDTVTGDYFVVMARAEKSLQQEIKDRKKLPYAEATRVLSQIVEGLIELGGIVHRDIKPGNILFHDGKWKLADFGIARFVEETTSLQTLKGNLTPPYGAPEQWLSERATVATDLYATGCVYYCMLCGNPPFEGPDFMNQHLSSDPPPLPSDVPAQFRTLAGMLLRKAPEARPSLERVKQVVADLTPFGPEPNRSPIAEAAARVQHAEAKKEALLREVAAVRSARETLAESGRSSLSLTVTRLRETVINDALIATRESDFAIKLGQAMMYLPNPQTTENVKTGQFPNAKLDVVLLSQIFIQQFSPDYSLSALLLYCRDASATQYRWMETSFFTPFAPAPYAPVSLLGLLGSDLRDIDLALSPTMHTYQVAFGPVAIDDENEAEFIERWTANFALAVSGRLKYPTRLPLDPKYWTEPGIYGW